MKLQTPFVFIGVLILLALIIAAGVLFFRETPGEPDEGAGGRADFFSSLFPFGEGLFGDRGTPGGEARDAAEDAREVPPLREVSGNPTSGGFFTDTGTIVFLESETGHVFETAPDTYATERISNATMPGIYEVARASDEYSFIARALTPQETIANVLLTFTREAARSLEARSLGEFARIAVAPSGGSALAVTETASGSRIERIDLSGQSPPRAVLSSPLRSWVPRIGGNELFVQTAPSSSAIGYLYKIESGELLRVVGGGFGFLANISPSGRYILYSETSGNGVLLSLLDIQTGRVHQAPTATFATKCAWLPDNEPVVFCGVPRDAVNISLDQWLMGLAHFEDDAWLVDPIKGTTLFIATLKDATGAGIDVVNPLVQDAPPYALFKNKKNDSLWSLSLISTE